MLVNRIKSKMSYYILKTHALAPETINIYPTFRCNLKCEMCFERFAEVEKELDINDWLRIIDEIKRFKPRIHLSGGEPFVYKKIINIIEKIKNSHLYLHITTNGTYLEDYAAELVKYRVNQIDISIDGPENLHDRIRGVRGTFNKIIRGLEKLHHLKKHLPLIKINSIINLSNPATMAEIIRVAEEYRALMIQFIYPLYLDNGAVEHHQKFLMEKLNKKINYWCFANRYKPAGGDFFEIQSVLKSFSQKRVYIDVFPRFNAKQFDAFYNSPGEFSVIYKGRCRAMWDTATILPDGDLESCPDYVVGNIKNESFSTAWNNEKMKYLRMLILNKNFFSVCRACCFYYQ
ncbi:MAG: radical SAM protein [candidate division WOR-3 bacterium]|nr:radical SAM protein [candidate division WOR-3 bacterium]